MKKYLPLKNNGQKENYLKIELCYSLGGYSFATYRKEPRGYYVSVVPVVKKLTDSGLMMEGFTAFTGIKKLMKEVNRKSEKAEKECETRLDSETEELINYVLREQGLELEA